MAASTSPNEEQRELCRTCGRQFASEVLVRHSRICQKTAGKKRTVFDSARQRAFGDELTYQHIKKAQRAMRGLKSSFRLKLKLQARNSGSDSNRQLGIPTPPESGVSKPSVAALRMRKKRVKLKENILEYQAYLKREAERNRLQRQNKTEEQKERDKETARVRARRKYAKKKAEKTQSGENTTETNKEVNTPKLSTCHKCLSARIVTRATPESRRLYNKLKKRESRAKMTNQKKAWVRKKDRDRKREKAEIKKGTRDYVQCETCGRRFNQTAAARHIPFCAEKNKRLPRQNVAPKKSSATSRIEYKSPKTKAIPDTPPSSTGGNRKNAKPVYPSQTVTQFHNANSRQTSQQRKSRHCNVNNGSASNTRYTGEVYKDVEESQHQHDLPHQNGRQYSKNSYTSPPSSATRHLPNSNGMDAGDGLYQKMRVTGSGRLLRTGKTPQMYEDAKRETKLGQVPRHASNISSSDSESDGELWAWTPPGGFAGSPLQHTRPGSGSVHVHQESECASLKSPQPKFCHDCGSKYPIATAKFCCECGVRCISMY